MIAQGVGYVGSESPLSNGQQEARMRWGTESSGAVFDQKKKSYLTEQAQEFIAQQAFCVIAGLDEQDCIDGLLVCERPGFVQLPDMHTCLLRLSRQYEESPILHRLQSSFHRSDIHLGLFFIHHPTRERLCVQGTAELLFPNWMSGTRFMGSPRSVWLLLHVRQAFFHCARYIKTRVAGLTAPSSRSPWRHDELLGVDQPVLTEPMRAFIAEQILCYLCTVDQHGCCAVNHRGGAAGFLATLPPGPDAPGGTILLPDYKGNGAFEAIGNILETGQAAIVVPDFTAHIALSISGRARVCELTGLPGEQARACAGAERVIAIAVTRVEAQHGDWSAFLAYERQRAEVERLELASSRPCPALV